VTSDEIPPHFLRKNKVEDNSKTYNKRQKEMLTKNYNTRSDNEMIKVKAKLRTEK
jgi:hypothetical protein